MNNTADAAIPTKPDLLARIERYKSQITDLQETLRVKNIALDALHYVWCSGGCGDRLLTEELVTSAEHQVQRMRTWLESNQWRKKWDAMSDEERKAWFAENALKKAEIS